MLYLSGKSRHDTYTAYRALCNDTAPDGGLFLPFHLPVFDGKAVAALGEKSFSRNAADILNLMFGTKLTEHQLGDILGDDFARYSTMNHHVVIGELWHGPDGNFERTVQALSDALRATHCDEAPTQWTQIAARIAVVFGFYGLMLSDGLLQTGERFDVASPIGDFSMPMAVWYARSMGLPVNIIIFGCNENSGMWDLMNLADLPTGETVVETLTPLCDHNVPRALARLIYAVLGCDEALHFDEVCQKGRHYAPVDESYEALRAGWFAAVSSISRIDNVIRNVYGTTRYILSPYDALAYGALLDYRSKSGQGSTCLLLSERCPLCDDKTVAYALGISTQELLRRMQSR